MLEEFLFELDELFDLDELELFDELELLELDELLLDELFATYSNTSILFTSIIQLKGYASFLLILLSTTLPPRIATITPRLKNVGI